MINNAGLATRGNFADVPLAKSMRMFHLHLTAAVFLTHAVLAGMLKRKRGAIIQVSSVAAFMQTPGNVMYDATKAFLAVFAENLLLEVKKAGIKIQALCPGFMHTEFHEVGDFKNFDKRVIPASVWMSADEVASLSLAALESGKRPVFIPGWKNRLSVWLAKHSLIFRTLIRKGVGARERDIQNHDINR